MKVKTLTEIPSARGMIPAGLIIEIPESVMKKLKGKVLEIKPMFDDRLSAKKNSHTSRVDLSPTVIVDPAAPAKAIWPPEVQSHIDWFMALGPPAEPFYLEPHLHIMDPAKFFSSLRMDIEAGPEGARGRHGALVHDLMTLKRILH